jgi:hypothetical protein
MTPSILMKCHKHQIDQAIAMIAQRVLDMDERQLLAIPDARQGTRERRLRPNTSHSSPPVPSGILLQRHERGVGFALIEPFGRR